MSDAATPSDPHEDDPLDDLRDTGVGVEDPNIVGDPEPGLVDEEVHDDRPPEV